MPVDDNVTRGDLEIHCHHIHQPLNDSVKELKLWLRGIVVGLLLLFVTALVNLLITNSTKGEVRDQRPRAHIERSIDNRSGGVEVQ